MGWVRVGSLGPFEGLDGLDGLDAKDAAFDQGSTLVAWAAPYGHTGYGEGGGGCEWSAYGFEEGGWVWVQRGSHG